MKGYKSYLSLIVASLTATSSFHSLATAAPRSELASETSRSGSLTLSAGTPIPLDQGGWVELTGWASGSQGDDSAIFVENAGIGGNQSRIATVPITSSGTGSISYRSVQCETVERPIKLDVSSVDLHLLCSSYNVDTYQTSYRVMRSNSGGTSYSPIGTFTIDSLLPGSVNATLNEFKFLDGHIVADFNGDGRDDLGLGTLDSKYVSPGIFRFTKRFYVLRNTAGTSFAQPSLVYSTEYVGAEYLSSGVSGAVQSLKGSSGVNLVHARINTTTDIVTVRTLKNNGSGSFSSVPAQTLSIPTPGFRLLHSEAGDLNGDGLGDLLLISHGAPVIQMQDFQLPLYGQANGQFVVGIAKPIGVVSTVVALKDLDADQKADLVFSKAVGVGVAPYEAIHFSSTDQIYLLPQQAQHQINFLTKTILSATGKPTRIVRGSYNAYQGLVSYKVHNVTTARAKFVPVVNHE